MDLEDDKAYLSTLFQAIKSDTVFINEFLDFQYNRVLPMLMNMRTELEYQLSSRDKNHLGAIRDSIFTIYDKCLVTCLAGHEGGHDKNHSVKFESIDDVLLLEVNKNLENDNSEISELVLSLIHI